MSEFEIYQADAFASKLFTGNPAAVVPLKEWLPDDALLAIAQENNLAETAYLIKRGEGEYDLRWFTPGLEVDLCGHATLASAHIAYTEWGEKVDTISFDTRSGTLKVSKKNEGYELDLPAYANHENAFEFSAQIEAAVGAKPSVVLSDAFLLAVFDDPKTVRAMEPNMLKVLEIPHHAHNGCILVTAPGDEGYDFISRLFAPGVGIPEDPVTGSAHCMTAVYWAERLGKNELRAFQASPRGGEVLCSVKGDRVFLQGNAVTYLRGRINV